MSRLGSVFDNADTEIPSDPGVRHTDELIREMYADVKVLKHSLPPLLRKAEAHDARLAKIEHTESKARGFIAGASAIGAGGIVAAIQAWFYKIQSGGGP